MNQRLAVVTITHHNDEGMVTGGHTSATGLDIDWQEGPLVDGVAPNGAFLETVIQAALQRVEAYQAGPLACRENALIITKLQEALHWAGHRRQDRIDRDVVDTYEP